MQNIDVVVLSNTNNLELYGITQRTINTLKWSEQDNFKFNTIIVESNKKVHEQGYIYHDCTHIIPNDDFGYNKFLNYGLRYCINDWVIVANNDLIFTHNWLTNMFKYRTDELSLSPWEPNWHIQRGMLPNTDKYTGYRTSFEITGWCLLIHKNVINTCKLFDPQFDFWYQDDDYALTLKHNNIKHSLITKSRVYHMISASHNLIDINKKFEMTNGQINKLRKKWKEVPIK